MHDSEPTYCLIGHLSWQALDDRWVVYQPIEGGLCALDALAAAVLSLLEAAPASAGQLAAEIANASGLAPDAELRERLASTLDELRHHGLIELQTTLRLVSPR